MLLIQIWATISVGSAASIATSSVGVNSSTLTDEPEMRMNDILGTICCAPEPDTYPKEALKVCPTGNQLQSRWAPGCEAIMDCDDMNTVYGSSYPKSSVVCYIDNIDTMAPLLVALLAVLGN